MEDQTKEIDQLIQDFHYLKNAVMKTNRVFKFISSKTLRPLYLWTALLIFTFTALIHWLILHYGSYDSIPGTMKTIYYSSLSILLIWLSFTKLKLLIQRVRELGTEITIGQLFREVYTKSTLVLMVPFLLTIGLAVVFLVSHGLSGYLVPCLAILYGLLIISTTSLCIPTRICSRRGLVFDWRFCDLVYLWTRSTFTGAEHHFRIGLYCNVYCQLDLRHVGSAIGGMIKID